jgi:hypothetical protein
MTAQNPHFSTVTWEDSGFFTKKGRAVFGTKDWQGIYGGITFDGESLVGIFYDSNSKRAPYLCPDTYDVNRSFQGMLSRHRKVADWFLKHFDFVEHVDGRDFPSVTTAFWDEKEYLAAADPWHVVMAEGARVARIELMEDIDQALADWQEEHEMSPEQVAFAKSLFNRKITHPEVEIELTQAEVEWLRSTSEEPSEDGIAACRGKLRTIGIRVP